MQLTIAGVALVACFVATPAFALRGAHQDRGLQFDERRELKQKIASNKTKGGSAATGGKGKMKEKATITTITTPSPTPSPTQAPTKKATAGPAVPLNPKLYQSSMGAFDVELPLISDKEILQGYKTNEELLGAFEQVARLFVNKGIEDANQQKFIDYQIDYNVTDEVLFPSKGGSSSITEGAPANSPTSAAGQTDFGTNNQEKGVDEADAVKSDGTYVYAAYGETLVVWDAVTGEKITNETMPAIPAIDYGNFTGGDFIGAPGKGIAASSICCGFYYQPKPYIRALQLDSSRLVVIVDGYGQTKRTEAKIESSILYDLLSTNVRVYDTSTLPSMLTLVTEFDINGVFQDARAIGENVHIVTTTSVNMWDSLYYPLQKWSNSFDPTLTDDEYLLAATELATTKLIPEFKAKLAEEVKLLGDPKLVKISLWESVLTGMEDNLFGGQAFQAYTQVTSFAATAPDTKSLAGSFMPTSWGYTYSTTEMLIFSGEGWDYLPDKDATGPTTYFLGFALDGATATPAAIGSVPGSLLSQYSLSIFEGHLRAATTIPNVWRWPSQSDGNGIVEFFAPVLESTAQNQVVILEIPVLVGGEPGVFTEVGRIANLGKEGESFTAFRFFGSIAYAVTFLRTDPFYVLDLDVANPRVLGELEITGFSSYLHSINANNTLLLAIGEEADADGRVLGLKIALFDATTPEMPELVQTFTVETDKATWSSSSVSWDFKAFRYLPLATPEVGILIIPVQVYAAYPETEGNFDGFIAYDISRGGISERGQISHVDSDQFYGCYSNAYLPERSLVFDGKVTTLKGHSVISTDLDTFVKQWELQLDDGVVVEQCHYWLY